MLPSSDIQMQIAFPTRKISVSRFIKIMGIQQVYFEKKQQTGRSSVALFGPPLQGSFVSKI